ncbi:hypothetical protein HHL26_23190 [Sphingobium sp. TB-6]|uniref:hypothetical protein n=1 Tax=Sphingobium sp. TB-6 TaxID=2728850 RepID=UPI00146F370E|nr:hypothetical protein [Sphingobium sp. TB-6]NML91912.1 hypothetical protein [Sphingobium sp. TB-6]
MTSFIVIPSVRFECRNPNLSGNHGGHLTPQQTTLRDILLDDKFSVPEIPNRMRTSRKNLHVAQRHISHSEAPHAVSNDDEFRLRGSRISVFRKTELRPLRRQEDDLLLVEWRDNPAREAPSAALAVMEQPDLTEHFESHNKAASKPHAGYSSLREGCFTNTFADTG